MASKTSMSMSLLSCALVSAVSTSETSRPGTVGSTLNDTPALALALACSAQSFPTNISGVHCLGLTKPPNYAAIKTVEDCAAACCMNTSLCVAYQFCADASTCGSPSSGAGCWIAENGVHVSCTEEQHGWTGAARWNDKCAEDSFPIDISGYECSGLVKAPNYTSIQSVEDCAAACCKNTTQCEAFQFCADAKFCGSPSSGAGCWIAEEGRSVSCTTVQDGWTGKARWKAPPPPPPPPALQTVTIDPTATGLEYGGFGGIVSNGECRMLYDYPEPQRSDILDYLFLPNFGLSSQVLKVEIGSDAQSTVGTEPAYQHSRGKISYSRGIMTWFMKEAKKRNPDIQIVALEWSAPGWVGNGTFFSDDNIDYILGWLHGAMKVNNITIDYIGIWNEPPIPSIPTQWIIDFRAKLDQNGYSNIKIMAPDASSTSSITNALLTSMVSSAQVRDAIDVIGTHGFWSSPPKDFSTLQENFGTRAWVSESWHQMGSWNGAEGMATKIINAHLQGNYSGWTAWGLLFAAYPNVLCQDKGLMYCTSPWGSGYRVQPSIWSTAHFTQFSRIGWKFLRIGAGSGTLEGGAQYITLTGDNELSIIINAFGLSCKSINVSFEIVNPGDMNLEKLQLWSTNEAEQFVRQQDIALNQGQAEIILQLQQGSLYSITSLSNGTISKGYRNHSELGKLFPLPHVDNFENLTVGRSPLYFTDWDGSFSIESNKDNGEDLPLRSNDRPVLRQLVLQKPIRWHCDDVDPITIVGEGIQNYEVTTAAKIESNTSDDYVAVYARVQRPYISWCPSASGYRLRVFANSSWVLEVADSAHASKGLGTYKLLDSGADGGKPTLGWINMSLGCNADSISASIGGLVVSNIRDSTIDSGSAGLGSGYHYSSFNHISISPLRPKPDDVLNDRQSKPSMYCSFTNVEKVNNTQGWFGMAFTVTRKIAVTDLARFASSGNTQNHSLLLLRNISNTATGQMNTTVLAQTSVNYSDPEAVLDSGGFVHSKLSEPVILDTDHSYLLVSQEASGADVFYGPASVQPCAGQIGPGGTLPRMVMLTDAVQVLGGVSTEDISMSSSWNLLWDWEARSWGPVTFSYADQN